MWPPPPTASQPTAASSATITTSWNQNIPFIASVSHFRRTPSTVSLRESIGHRADRGACPFATPCSPHVVPRRDRRPPAEDRLRGAHRGDDRAHVVHPDDPRALQ